MGAQERGGLFAEVKFEIRRQATSHEEFTGLWAETPIDEAMTWTADQMLQA